MSKSYDLRTQGDKTAPPGLRHPEDAYWTPPEAVTALLSIERFEGAIWEPACGTGNISEVFIKGHWPVVSTDLYDWDYSRAFLTSLDFLAMDHTLAPNIVTNPPYSLCLEFLKHALELPEVHKVAFLLRLQYLEGVSRVAIYRGHRLKVYIFERRLGFMVNGKVRRMVPYAWYVFDNDDHRDLRTFDYI